MQLSSLFSKLAPMGVAALGAIAVSGIATAPAQASVINIGSDLSWDDGFVESWLADVNPDLTGPLDNPDTFSATYDDTATIEGVSGDFVNWLNVGDVVTFGPHGQLTSNFLQVEGLPDTPPAIAVYEVVGENVIFDFTDELEGEILPKIDEPIETIKYVIPTGTQYLLSSFSQGQAAEFDLCVETCIGAPFWEINGTKISATNTGDFQELLGASPTYGISTVTGEKVVPEPASLLGLLTIGGLGLGLKRKKQA
jgi:hypothetical protein